MNLNHLRTAPGTVTMTVAAARSATVFLNTVGPARGLRERGASFCGTSDGKMGASGWHSHPSSLLGQLLVHGPVRYSAAWQPWPFCLAHMITKFHRHTFVEVTAP